MEWLRYCRSAGESRTTAKTSQPHALRTNTFPSPFTGDNRSWDIDLKAQMPTV